MNGAEGISSEFKNISSLFYSAISETRDESRNTEHTTETSFYKLTDGDCLKVIANGSILECINTTIRYKKNIAFEYKNVAVNVNLFFTNSLDTDDNYIELIKLGIITSLYQIDALDEKIHLNVDIFLIDQSKQLTRTPIKIVEAKHINSSFSSVDGTINICVYRAEEWFKDLMCELFRSFSVDLLVDGTDFNNLFSTHSFSVTANFSLETPIIDFWSRVYNVALFTFDDEMSLDCYIENFHKNIELERVFSITQSKQLLSFFGISYFDAINPSRKHTNKKYKENVGAFGLYIMTSIFFCNFDHVIQWLVSKHKLFKIEKNDKELVIFSYFIAQTSLTENTIKMFQEDALLDTCYTNSIRTSLFDNKDYKV